MANPNSGHLVRQAREAKSLSRESLAFQTDLSVSTIARLELNDRIPHVRALTRICAVLGLSLTDVVPDAPSTTDRELTARIVEATA